MGIANDNIKRRLKILRNIDRYCIILLYGDRSPACRQAGQRLEHPPMYYVYILISKKDEKFYTGITNNLERRIVQHNIGYNATKSTVNRGPFKLLFVQECKNRLEARQLEKFLKSGSGRELRNNLLK